jgi:hypothetical protein
VLATDQSGACGVQVNHHTPALNTSHRRLILAESTDQHPEPYKHGTHLLVWLDPLLSGLPQSQLNCCYFTSEEAESHGRLCLSEQVPAQPITHQGLL